MGFTRKPDAYTFIWFQQLLLWAHFTSEEIISRTHIFKNLRCSQKNIFLVQQQAVQGRGLGRPSRAGRLVSQAGRWAEKLTGVTKDISMEVDAHFLLFCHAVASWHETSFVRNHVRCIYNEKSCVLHLQWESHAASNCLDFQVREAKTLNLSEWNSFLSNGPLHCTRLTCKKHEENCIFIIWKCRDLFLSTSNHVALHYCQDLYLCNLQRCSWWRRGPGDYAHASPHSCVFLSQ